MADVLRIRMKGRETVFELTVAKRDVRTACAQHMIRFGREGVPTGRKNHRGLPILEHREVPKDTWIFEWVTTTDGVETVEPVTLR